MIDLDITSMPLVFIDVETTGFSATKNRMIEVAATRVEGGKVTQVVSTLLSMPDEVHPKITEITGIKQEDLVGKPEFIEIAPQLMRILDGAIFVAHNAKFDYAFFKEEFRRINEEFSAVTLCTVELSKLFFPSQANHKLQTLIELHQFTFTDRHRAEDDANILRQFLALIERDFGIENLRANCQRVLI